LIASTYRAPRWLPGGHVQTIYPLLIKGTTPAYERERWDTPDGDFIDLDWVPGPATAPLVVLFHGLEGSSSSHYARALMRSVIARSWRGVVVHFRGCSGEPNRLPRAYHSGDADEIDWVLKRLKSHNPHTSVYAVGVSLGGNALLKWAGTRSRACLGITERIAAISAPLDVAIAGRTMSRRENRLYQNNFLATMKPVAAEKHRRFPGLFDAARVAAATTLEEFDDAFTAPVHGFKDVHDFWRQVSSKPDLKQIRVESLVMNARNDPFLPHTALPKAHEVSATVRLEQPEEGGHVGFAVGPFPGNIDWLPERVLRFFSSGQ
jgi:predicted alpha/beta-fold hydrolase